MYIITQDPNTIGHKVVGFSVAGNVVTAMITSFTMDPIADPGGMVPEDRTNSYPVPRDELLEVTEDAITEWLASPAGPLSMGVTVEDEEYAFQVKQRDMSMKVKQLRDQHELGGIDTPFGHPIDTNADSQRKILGGATLALMATVMSQPFARTWRMADDYLQALDGPGMMQLGVLVADHVDACQSHKNALDSALAAATTVEELEAIDINAGWPGT